MVLPDAASEPTALETSGYRYVERGRLVTDSKPLAFCRQMVNVLFEGDQSNAKGERVDRVFEAMFRNKPCCLSCGAMKFPNRLHRLSDKMRVREAPRGKARAIVTGLRVVAVHPMHKLIGHVEGFLLAIDIKGHFSRYCASG